MQVDISNIVNVSTTNAKDLASSDAGAYTKAKPEEKFGAVLQKEKKNLSSNENKSTKEVDVKDVNKIETSKIEVSNLKDTSSISKDKVEIKELETADDESIQEPSKELEIKVDKDSEELSKDDILSCLAAIVELINKMASSKTNTEGQKINGDGSTLNSKIPNIQTNNSIINLSVADELSLAKVLTISVKDGNNESSINQEKAVKVINNLLSILGNGDDNKLLNKENLTTIQGLLNELGVKLDEEVGSKDIKAYNILKELVKDARTEVNTLVEVKTAKEILQNNIVDKGLALKEETPKFKNVEITSAEKVNEVNYAKENLIDKNLTDSEKESNQNSSSNLNKKISKEEKLLSSILEDGDEKVDNKFASIADRLGIKTTTPINVETQVINKESIATDVVKNVKFMVTNNMKEMTIKINPEQLGEITIKVIEEGQAMKANIKASSKETYNLLSQQLGDIKKHLGEQNIKIQEVNISIYDEDATFYKDGQFSSNSFQDGSNNRQKNGYISTGEFPEEELSDNSELYEEGNINMLA